MLALTDLKPGDTLGRYEILMPVAQGGMASVWAARMVGSRGFQKVVAIKTMLPALTDDPDFEAMFLDEARLASKIRHPHVAEIVDLGEEGDWIYIVMEWVNGETIFTLNKVAKARGGIPLPLAIRIVSNTCAGLHAAHELRDEDGRLLDLVHRDISPQNILISDGGIVKVVDFGIAKAAGRLHETRVSGLMKGKVPYMSPEQLTGGKVDRRADIFSLGMLAYVMLTGRHPFKGENDARTMENICSRGPVPLHELVPGTPPELEAVVMRALAKSPGDRFRDCAEMQRALDQINAASGASITDGDVAAFVREMLGDRFEERRTKLAEAIRRADAGAVSDRAERDRRSSVARPASGGARPASGGARVASGAPLSATFGGILPVALEEAPAPARAPYPGSRTLPSAVFVAPAVRRRSPLPYVAFAVVAVALAVAAFAVTSGLLR